MSPQTKIALWVLVVAVLAAVIQAVSWALGLDFDIFSRGGGGHGVLLALAVGTVLLMMAADRRGAADYGLSIGRNWPRLLFRSFAIGALVYAVYCGLALWAGAFRWQADSLTIYKGLRAGVSALAAFPVALCQQIIFSGYLLGILRDRHGRVSAVVTAALLFAVLCCLEDPASLLDPEAQPLVIGMFLTATLLGVLRLQTGSILYPTGFLAGCIFVRRVLRRTEMLVPVGSSTLSPWMAPHNDPRQAPLMWLFVAIGIGACWWMLWRRGEDQPGTAQPALDASFKRVFPFSHGNMLAPLDVWLGRLIAARFRVGVKYIPRLLAILMASAANTVLSLPERLVLPLLLRRRRLADPVFIVGVHRSGTTHLHNLLALDTQFSAPRTYQIMNPAGFMFSGWLVAPILGMFFPWKRPMDSVRFHLFSPQEEEFAIAGASRTSPYWGLTFPRQGAAYDRYIFTEHLSPQELAAWKRHYLFFLRKLTYWSGKRPLLKNPYNTGRIAVLREMFPLAKFIHIHRHPYAVFRSNMHTAREGHVINQLQDPDKSDSYQTRFLGNYRAMEDAFYGQSARLPSDRVAEVRFEDLERDPVGAIRRIYARLGLTLRPRFKRRLKRYLESIADYQKNRFEPLSEGQRNEIETVMGHLMQRCGYARDEAPPPRNQNQAA